MSVRRESPYATSHKGLRNAIGRFQLLAGSTAYDNPAEVARLQARGGELALLLTHHLEAEDRYFLTPLAGRLPEAAQRDRGEHEHLEGVQAAMMGVLARLDGRGTPEDGHAFYLQVTDFHAQYLAHILHEERETEPAMYARFTEAEMAEWSNELLRNVEIPVLVASLRYIVPAQPAAESRALLARIREAPFYWEVMEALREDLGEEAVARLG